MYGHFHAKLGIYQFGREQRLRSNLMSTLILCTQVLKSDAYSVTNLNKSFDRHHIATMADLALLEDLHAPVRHKKVFRDSRDFFMESDEWLLSSFRLPGHLLLQLCQNLEPQLRRETRCSNAIPVPVQVLSTLGFLATGTFQRKVAWWPRVTHYSFIWQNSSVGTWLQQGPPRIFPLKFKTF